MVEEAEYPGPGVAGAPGTPAAAAKRRPRFLRLAQGLVSLAIVVGIFAFALPQITDYRAVWATISDLTPIEVTTLTLVTLFNLFTYWPQMVSAMPGLSLAQAAVTIQSSTSIANTLPGGGAIAVGVSYAMYRSWGFSKSEIALATMLTGIWNGFLKLALPIVALALLTIEGLATVALLIPALIGVGILLLALTLTLLVLWKKSLAHRIGRGLGTAASFLLRLVRRPPVAGWADTAVRFRKETITLVSRRWLPLTVTTVLSHLGLWFVLVLTLRHVGVSEAEISSAQILAVFAFARLITTIPITPGGVGVIELALIAGLVLAGRGSADVPVEAFRVQVVAAVLVFRTLTYAMQIPMGAVTYLLWRRNPRWLRGATR